MWATQFFVISGVLLAPYLLGQVIACGFGQDNVVLEVFENTTISTVLLSVNKTNTSYFCEIELRDYIRANDKNYSIDFVLTTPFGDRFDQGIVKPNSIIFCQMECGTGVSTLVVNVEIIDINNRAPVFNAAGQTIKLSQAMPVGIDFGSLINEGRLSVYDGDFDTQTNGAIVLTLNNSNFQILPPIVGTAANVPYKDPKIFYPRVALAQPLTSNTSFQLIAQDKGDPPRINSISINVLMEQYAC